MRLDIDIDFHSWLNIEEGWWSFGVLDINYRSLFYLGVGSYRTGDRIIQGEFLFGLIKFKKELGE